MQRLDHRIELANALTLAFARELDGDLGRRSFVGVLASPLAFRRAGSGVVVSCQPIPLPSACAARPTDLGELALPNLHRYLHGRALPYTFTTVDALVDDFIAAVDAARTTP